MTLTLEDFTSYLSTPFLVEGHPQAAPFVLVEAKPLPERSAGQLPRPPFVLLFAVADPQIRAQDHYALEHPGLDTIELFLVPVGKDDRGILYEAVFN